MHFGLLELAEGQPNRYGGLGLMLESPRLRLRWRWQDDAPRAALAPTVEVERRIELAQSHALSVLSQHALLNDFPTAGKIEVLECPPMHSGLGVGTQLATAVAQLTALAIEERSRDHRPLHAAEAVDLARISGRGKRSAIGLHGFLHGGLVRDLGYEHRLSIRENQRVRPVQTHSVPLPVDWMVVLCCSCSSGDVHGPLEDQLIGRAATQANPQRERMLQLSDDALHAANSDDFHGFTNLLSEYMELASRLFAHVQSGRYRDQHTARRVEQMQAAGLAGVGQSSWGPTVFGFAPNVERAQAAADLLMKSLDSTAYRIVIARPKSSGAQWSMTSAGGKQHAG